MIMGFNADYLLTSQQLTCYVNQYVQSLNRKPVFDDKNGLLNMPCIKRYKEQLEIIHSLVAKTFATYVETTYLARCVTPMNQIFNGYNHYSNRRVEFEQNLNQQDQAISRICREAFLEFYHMSKTEIVYKVSQEVNARINHQLTNIITNTRGAFESNSAPIFRTHIIKMDSIENSLKSEQIFIDLIMANKAQKVGEWFNNYYHTALINLSKACGYTLEKADEALIALPPDYKNTVAGKLVNITLEPSLN